MIQVEYLEGDQLAKVEAALGRTPLVPGANGRIALVVGLLPGEDLTPERYTSLVAETRDVAPPVNALPDPAAATPTAAAALEVQK